MEKVFSKDTDSIFKIIACGIVFISAFLLFQVQPLIGKYFLPFFGGSSSVWMTSVFFFQAVLVGGYFYAQRLTRFHTRYQVVVHTTILVCTSILLLCLWNIWPSPITPPLTSDYLSFLPPRLYIVSLLVLGVGAPYFVLSSTSSLIQEWYRLRRGAESPYYLYAFSNAGSLIGLVSFPFLFEPLFTTQRQADIWGRLFLLYAISFAMFVLFLKKKTDQTCCPQEHVPGPSRSPHVRLLWSVIPFLTTVLFLSTTNALTHRIANIPFLWVVPLALYLISFIICFSRRNIFRQLFFSLLTLLGVCGVYITIWYDFRLSVGVHISILSLYLFSACLLLHGALYWARPRHDQLTTYYLAISCGGACGGFFVALIAPFIFNSYFEFWLTLGITVGIAVYTLLRSGAERLNKDIPHWRHVVISFAVAFACLWLMAAAESPAGALIEKKRNFYGLLDVRENISKKYGPYRVLRHGAIKHGIQYQEPPYELYPSAYFYPESGIGTALDRHPRRKTGQALDVGVIGLGIGTLATYGRVGDHFRFYELDPEIGDFARTYFTYLRTSRATVETVFGDGRLSLQKEIDQHRQPRYDVLVLDAFSGGTIPVHLVTHEAFLLYEQCLKDEHAIIAMNITNKFVSLVPQIKSLAVALDLEFVIIETEGDGELRYDATWALLTRDKRFIDENFIVLKEKDEIPGGTLWTDSYSNVLAALK